MPLTSNFRAYIDTSSGADAWRTEVTKYRNRSASTASSVAQNLGVPGAGVYYAVTGERMDESTIRDIIDNVRVNNNDVANDSGTLNQTTPNSNPPVSNQSGNNGSSSAPSNSVSGNTSGSTSSSGSGNGTKPSQDGIKGNGSGDVDKDDDAGQTTATPAAAPNYLVFGLIAAAVAAGFFFIILLKRRKEEEEQ